MEHGCSTINASLLDFSPFWMLLHSVLHTIVEGKNSCMNELILVEPSSCIFFSSRPIALYLSSFPFFLSQLSILCICIPSICVHNFVVNALNKCCCYVVMEKVRTIPLPKSNKSWIMRPFLIYMQIYLDTWSDNFDHFHSWLCGTEQKSKSKWSQFRHCMKK